MQIIAKNFSPLLLPILYLLGDRTEPQPPAMVTDSQLPSFGTYNVYIEYVINTAAEVLLSNILIHSKVCAGLYATFIAIVSNLVL